MRSKYNKDYFENKFSSADPWNYTSSKYEYKKYREQIAISDKYAKNPSSILEIGCAEGMFTEMIHREHPSSQITAIDISDKAIERARQKQVGNTTFIRTDIVDFIESNDRGPFDIIYLSEIIYYLGASLSTRDLLSLVRKLSLILNKNGIMVMTNNVFTTEEIPVYIVERPLIRTYEYLVGTVLDSLETKSHTYREPDRVLRYRLSVYRKI